MRGAHHYLLGLVLVLGAVLSACAAPKAPTSAPTPAPTVARPAAPALQPSREEKLIEGAKKEGEVVLWVSTIGDRAKLIGLFEARYPFLKLKMWDSIEVEVIGRLNEEAKAGRHSVDVLLISKALVDAHAAGLLEEYDWPNTAGWPDQPKHSYYRTPYATAKVIPYNTDLVSPAEVPKSWDDVKSSKWAGKTLMSTSATDIPLLWAYLWRENDKLNWDRSFAFWGDVIRNTKPRVVSGYGSPMERLAAGEATIFMPVPTPSTLRMIIRGAPIGVAPLGKAPGDAMGMALARGAPHPNAARLLLDWLTTTEGLLAYVDPTMMLAIAPEAARQKARANGFLGSLGLSFDLVPGEIWSVENLKKSGDFWMKALGLRG